MKKNKLLVLGDEAIAQGALDAGISGAYAYPGTPSTEILEYIQRSEQAAEGRVHRKWSANEKTAYEEALGVSYAGKRAMVSMKHVGLNVASDPFVNSAITGANGGLLVVVADDPSMHSSQNEQDTRYYAKFAQVPLLEPSTQKQAYDMAFEGFELSEETGLPVVLRITTRLAHSRSAITRREPREQNGMNVPSDPRRYTLLPANARKNYVSLLKKQPILLSKSKSSPYNEISAGRDNSLACIATGVAVNYLEEVFADGGCPYPVLKIRQYPVPKGFLTEIAGKSDTVLVFEEGAPFVEEICTYMLQGCKVKGRLDGTLPRTGELSPNEVAEALGRSPSTKKEVPEVVRPRPPKLCGGCPHVDTYKFLNEALDGVKPGRVLSDIGCYTLGALPPFKAIYSCVDMGASITLAKGASDGGMRPSVAVIGDSTFTHSGMTGLLDAVYENTPMTVLILDNDTVAMTGGQESLSAGRLDSIISGLGVPSEHFKVLTPLPKNHEANVRILKEELIHEGISVVICRRPCVHLKKRRRS